MSGRGKGAEIGEAPWGEPGGRHCNAPSNGGGPRAPQPELARCGAAASGRWSSGSGVNCPHPSPDFGTRPHSPPLLPTGPQHLVPLSAWEVTPRGKKKKKITRSVWVARR